MLTIRPARLDDAPAIHAVDIEALHYELAEEQAALQLAVILRQPFYRIWVAEKDRAVCGYLQACDHMTTGSPSYKLVMVLAVLPAFQGLGIGKQLLQRCEEWAKEDGAYSIRLFSSMGRTAAHAFYEKRGYVLRKTHKNFYKIQYTNTNRLEVIMDLLNYQAKAPFQQKHLLTLQDYSADEIFQTLSLALRLKRDLKEKGGFAPQQGPCAGQTLAMIFTKSSTRTRVSFETGFYQLGGQAMFLSSNDIQLGRGEPISDTARVLGRMVDGIMIRTFAHSDVEGLAEHSGIPVINGLTDDYHPCQVLADLLTYYEHRGTLSGKLAFIGDGNNMAHSLLIGCSKIGMDVAIASPADYMPHPDIIAKAQENAKISGSQVVVTTDPVEAASGADCIYTDVWASMGQEAEQKKREAAFAAYQVDDELVKHAKPDFIFQHCLPAHRGEEVAAAVIDGAHSVVYDEAENRLHAQKAVLVQLMGK